MRKATRVWVDGLAARLHDAVTSARVSAETSIGVVVRELYEADDRANERHQALAAQVAELASAVDRGLAKLLERDTRAAAERKVDRKVAVSSQVTSLPTPAPKRGGTDTALAVLNGAPVEVVSRAPSMSAAPTVSVVDSAEGVVHHGLVSSSDAARLLRENGKSLGRRASLGQVEGALRREDGRWVAPFASWKALVEKLNA